MTSPYPGACPVLAHSNKRHPETTRVSGVLCLELRSKTNTRTRAAPCVLRHYMGLGSYVLGLGGRDQYISFLLSQSSCASLVALVVKNPPSNEGDLRDEGSIPGSGRFPREGNGNPFQYSCPENSMNRGAWRATVHRVTQSETWLKQQHQIYINTWLQK